MPGYPADPSAEILAATSAHYQDARAACRAARAVLASCGDAVHVTVIAEALREVALALDGAGLVPQQVAALIAEGEQRGYERARAEFERPARLRSVS